MIQQQDHLTQDDDLVFEFFEGFEEMSSSSSEKSSILEFEEDVEEEEKESVDQNFWETHHNVLKETLYRSSSFESRVRSVVKEALKEIELSSSVCLCGSLAMPRSCKACLMRHVLNKIGSLGFDSAAICTSKWRKSSDIPSGQHTFLDVVDKSSSKKPETRIIIELNFRAEFEIARASEEYNRLVRRLPEVFVGKVERLKEVIKILCSGAKKCMKEKKMHMGPWRKQKYMRSKWFNTCERASTTAFSTRASESDGQTSNLMKFPIAKPKASMLTVDLRGIIPNMHGRAVAVL